MCVTLVGRNKEGLIPFIEKKAGVKFERVGAPQPADMAKVAGERASEALKEMDDQIVPWFQAAAASLLEDMPAEKALALALAKITGNTQLKVNAAACSLAAPLPAVCSLAAPLPDGTVGAANWPFNVSVGPDAMDPSNPHSKTHVTHLLKIAEIGQECAS